MQSLWTTLENHTRSWHDLDRQAVADAVWADYVAVRFARTGDLRALQFLYPYLNSADRGERLHAIQIAGLIFEGRGPKAVDDLTYFIRNTDPFLLDRAVWPIAAALAGSSPDVVLQAMRPYLDHRNRFVQSQAAEALGRAAASTASDAALDEVLRLTQLGRLDILASRRTVAQIFASRPSERAYLYVVDVNADWSWHGTDYATGILLQQASQEWYLRACHDFFLPRLAYDQGRFPQFMHASAAEGLSMAGRGRGMHPFQAMLPRRGNACVGYRTYKSAPLCFAGADAAANRGPLLELLRTGDVPTIRMAAVCLGRLLQGTEDAEAIQLLQSLCASRNGAVRAAALTGIGRLATSTCSTDLRTLCLQHAKEPETATAAIGALGRIFAGSGQPDVLEDIRQLADYYRAIPAGRHHSRPLLACYAAVGDLYAGTGSSEPLDFLLKALAPSPVRWCPFRWTAGRALVKIEFSQRAVARVLGED